MRSNLLRLGGIALAALVLAACAGPATTVAPPPPTEPPPEAAPLAVPFEAEWAGSAHADASAEAFRHWDEDDPPVIPAACAKCHSETGYLDFLGEDGTAVGAVDVDQAPGTVVSCVACHNASTLAMDSVVMPSGAEITALGREARCMQCHQGRESTVSVNAHIENAGVDDDAVSPDLGFRNIHYFAAAATKYGTFAQGGYQYEGKTYDGNFAHVTEYDSCVECHNPHTLEVKVSKCAVCHTGVAAVDDLKDIRMPGSLVDYDGDGDLEEGVSYELDGLREKLYLALQAYAAGNAGTPIAYSSAAYPYFFIDTDGDGTADPDEAAFPNRYASWTPRLLRAAYNYQVSLKDPGAFAHGGKYILQLLTDSIEDLNTVIAAPVAMEATNRIDAGHFAGSTEAFRHWDEDGAVPASCSRCHSAEGLPLFMKDNTAITQPVSNGLTCETCHNDVSVFSLYPETTVPFPGGATVTFSTEKDADGNLIPVPANLCLNCHQGRESTRSVNTAITNAGVGDDDISDKLSFRNPHYFAAGATLFGADVSGAYQFAGKTYLGRFAHVPGFSTCTDCHSTHGLQVKFEACTGCHPGVADPREIRGPSSAGIDYDGDGDAEEGIAEEIASMKELLLEAVYAYGAGKGAAIVYDSHAYPYFFNDKNGNGEADPDEANFGNRYLSWTPKLLRAAYNYQWVAKDPGAFAHNGKYMLQVLYDSLQSMGVGVGGMTRP